MLVLASIYALISCGYVLIYRTSRVLSLAHGELMMLGAYGLYATASLFTGRPLVAIAAAVLLALVVGVLVYVALMRHMAGEAVLAAVLTTIALGILLRRAMGLLWGGQEQHPMEALGFLNASLTIGQARISVAGLGLVAATACVYGGLWAFLRYSVRGMRMRAAGQNPLLAAQRGIGLHGIYALAWGLATLTAGLAGMPMAGGLGRRPTLGGSAL